MLWILNIQHKSDKLFKKYSVKLLITYFKGKSAEQVLRSLLKKCPNIIRVNIRSGMNRSVLSMIGRYCPRIKSLTYCGSIRRNFFSFFRIYGHKLEELDIEGNNDDMTQYLRHCPNIKKIISRHNSYVYNDDKEFLPKLERIESIICVFPFNDFKILSDKYSLSMKTLNLKLDYLKAEELKTCIDCISRFENLRQLTLSFDYSNDRELIDESIAIIGKKCTKVFELDLRIKGPVLISDRFFRVLPNFRAIKKIKLYFPYIKSIDGSIECFKHCKQLIDIDINYPATERRLLHKHRVICTETTITSNKKSQTLFRFIYQFISFYEKRTKCCSYCR